MKRALEIFALFSFFSLTFLPGDLFGGACSNSLSPPFIASGVTPNILIILDNSNSMDEDFYGNAVGSYSPISKTVVAKQALQNVVTSLQGKANVGIMTYSLPNDITAMQIHNAMPFASYNPNSYCPNPDPVNILTWPPQACVDYCTNPNDTASQAACDAACQPNASLGQTFTSFTSQLFTHNDGTQTNFPDLIITNYAANDPTRARYCGLAYPKTQMWQYNNPLGFTTKVYYNQTDPFYDWGDDGVLYGYTGADDPVSGYSPYSPGEGAANVYTYCPNKRGTSDSWNGYTGWDGTTTNGCQNYQFEPTDSDWALGFWNWGQAMPWYWVGPTWFSWSQGSGNPQGYLHVPVGPVGPLNYCYNTSGVSNGQACSTTSDCTAPYNSSCSGSFFCFNVSGVSNGQACSSTSDCAAPYNSSCTSYAMSILNPEADSTNSCSSSACASTPWYPSCPCSYMSCPSGEMNTCPYIVNASNTPTAGTLQTAFNYFNGTLPGYSSPISALCQRNFIIYATDGLPSTFINGSQPTPVPAVMSSLLQEVIQQLNNLQAGVTQTIATTPPTSQTFPIKTYVLGMGLTAEAKTNLDQMAVAGGTVTSAGHAYYADNPTQFVDALNSIITDLLSNVSAGSAISILSEGQTQNGANMLQGVFYPTRAFGSTAVSWPGFLYDYWFYNSPTYNNSSRTYCFSASGLTNAQTCSSVSSCAAPFNSSCTTSTTYNNIREDTVHDFILELNEDNFISFVFGDQSGLTVNRYSGGYADSSGNPVPDNQVDNVGLDSLTPLWEAGKLLFQTTPASRQIFTPGNSTTGLVSFDATTNAALTTPGSSPLGSPANFDPCLQGSSDAATLQNLINYVRGTDLPTCRNRTGGLCSSASGITTSPCNSNPDCGNGSVCTQNVWKLGDIVYSTPQVQADYKFCYDGSSFSTQSCSFDSDCSSGDTCQKKESVVFVGANDGMLHAFRTGILSTAGLDASKFQVAELTGIPTSSMGQELWGFIPNNSLPYLRCLAVPPPGSCHLYYNDLAPYITTMYANGQQKTVLIGGMRLGGGAINSSTPGNYCFNSSGVTNGQTCSNASNCTAAPYNSSCSSAYLTNAPSDTCAPVKCANPSTCYSPSPGTLSNCTGLSAYYALDITDAENPKLLWEFSHPFLGYSYSGPAVIHKWSNPTYKSGDQYYVMFLSGPTNGTDGSSVQDVQAFVLTLNANLGISSMYYKDLGASTKNGFGGRLFTNGLDVNGDGYTDFVLFGYGNSVSGSPTGWTGGIGKVNTNNTDASDALEPADWTWDITTYANVATLPVTGRIAAEQCFNNGWYLFAGTGRYFFPKDNYGQSGNAGLNQIMGMPFTCDQYNNNCGGAISLNDTSAAACSSLQQAASNPSLLYQAGWKYTLDAGSGLYLNERLITDPTIDPGTPGNPGDIIYFVTSEPTSDPCGYGGHSRVWGMNCATGAAISDQSCNGYSVPAADVTGTLYLQTSTGAINQINAATSFTQASTGDRSTPWFIGMPPENSPPLVQPANPSGTPTGQLIQWIER
ncbi:MAG: hypothetical protein ABSF90_05230 [Syntrophobacteraceae bacterium]|jgi:hypothetical protein